MNAAPAQPAPPRLTFRKRHRLARARDYQTVFRDGVRKGRGPFVLFVNPNALGHSRLGLSVPRRVGNAAARNMIKRRLREVFRHSQHEMPRGYDLVVAVRPHDPLPLEEYRRLLLDAWRAADAVWTKRRSRNADA
ncbi:MAG: ribonuclease P protein component [Phycisphaeraceae bacterium]|nr:ribonuclease P protein component [Phycisphaeraceae bacterium]MCB9848341.1 ribonuclease P protein component [Phycisphaeraceae bacterium]